MTFSKSTLLAALFAAVTLPNIARGEEAPETLAPRGNEQPSFDCTKAKTAAARLICADGELARLDGELGAAYQKRKVQISVSDQSKFVAEQLAWIRERNKHCGLDNKGSATIEELANSKACMMGVISERIAFLAQPDPGAAPALLQSAGTETAVLPPGEIAALRAKIFSLWTPPATDVPNQYDVKIRIHLNRDGRLAEPPLILTNGQGSLFVATGESAVRAIIQAQPFDMLSQATYTAWKEIDFTFAPREAYAGATSEPAASANYWWCDAPRGYYPSVPRCSTAWRVVGAAPATAQQAIAAPATPEPGTPHSFASAPAADAARAAMIADDSGQWAGTIRVDTLKIDSTGKGGAVVCHQSEHGPSCNAWTFDCDRFALLDKTFAHSNYFPSFMQTPHPRPTPEQNAELEAMNAVATKLPPTACRLGGVAPPVDNPRWIEVRDDKGEVKATIDVATIRRDADGNAHARVCANTTAEPGASCPNSKIIMRWYFDCRTHEYSWLDTTILPQLRRDMMHAEPHSVGDKLASIACTQQASGEEKQRSNLAQPRWYVAHMDAETCVPLSDVSLRFGYGADDMNTPDDLQRYFREHGGVISPVPGSAATSGTVAFHLQLPDGSSTNVLLFSDADLCKKVAAIVQGSR